MRWTLFPPPHNYVMLELSAPKSTAGQKEPRSYWPTFSWGGVVEARGIMEGRTQSTAPACARLSALPRSLPYGFFCGWMHLLFAAISPPSHFFYCLPRGHVLARRALLFFRCFGCLIISVNVLMTPRMYKGYTNTTTDRQHCTSCRFQIFL